MDSSYNSSTTKPIYQGTQIVWYILGVIEVLLAFRFVLKMLAAGPSAGFSKFIYGATWLFAQPFVSVFRTSQAAGSVVEWSTLLAMFVYWILALGIIRIFMMSKTISTPEAAAKLDENEKEQL